MAASSAGFARATRGEASEEGRSPRPRNVMAWFWKRDKEEAEERPRKVVIAEGLWIKCDSCKEIVYRAEVERAGRVCPKCRYPFRIGARERLALLIDEGSLEERDAGLASQDPLGFKDTKRYRDRLKSAKEKTGLEEAVISGLARIGGIPTVVCVFEFDFMGGSMASGVGEKITRAIELALVKPPPPALPPPPPPPPGGAPPSSPVLGDVLRAAPRALIGFAGPRVIAETIRQPLP